MKIDDRSILLFVRDAYYFHRKMTDFANKTKFHLQHYCAINLPMIVMGCADPNAYRIPQAAVDAIISTEPIALPVATP